MKGYSSKSIGFTLIELMVASAITAVIGIIAATMLPSMIENHAQVLKEEKALIKVERALQIIRSDIEQIVIRPSIFPFGEKAGSTIVDPQHIQGSENALTFSLMFSTPDKEAITQEIQRVRYFVESGKLIRENINSDFPAANQQWHRIVLLDNIESLKFQYLLKDWEGSLLQAKEYPKAILVTVNSKRWERLELVATIAGVKT